MTEPVLLHFGEDPSIEVFEPHVAATAAEDEPLVWAVDDAHQPMFWFPRQCPRATLHSSRMETRPENWMARRHETARPEVNPVNHRVAAGSTTIRPFSSGSESSPRSMVAVRCHRYPTRERQASR